MPRSTLASSAAAVLTVVCAVTTVLPAAELGAQIAPGSTLVFTGVADASDIGKAGVTLAFDKRVDVDPSANTGTFASLNRRNGANGSIEDIRVGNGPQDVQRFLHVGAYTFDLGFVPSGMYAPDECYIAPVVGQRCTPFQSVVGDPSDNDGLSPFFVENLASGDPNAPFTSVATFNVLGTVSGPGRSTSSFFGTIAATFPGLSYQEALYTLEQYGLEDVTFTGTFVTGPTIGAARATFAQRSLASGSPVLLAETVVPEPSAVALLATGLGALGAAARRRRRD